MDRFPQMLYRAGGSEEIHGGKFSTLIVAGETELSDALAGGWHETTAQATAAAESPAADAVPADDAPPTRDEMLQQAEKIGMKVDARWSDATLLSKLNAALAAQG